MAKKPLFGVNTYVETTKKKIGRHNKNMNKQEKKIIKNIVDKGDRYA